MMIAEFFRKESRKLITHQISPQTPPLHASILDLLKSKLRGFKWVTKKRVSVESVEHVEPLLDLGYKIMQIEKELLAES